MSFEQFYRIILKIYKSALKDIVIFNKIILPSTKNYFSHCYCLTITTVVYHLLPCYNYYMYGNCYQAFGYIIEYIAICEKLMKGFISMWVI